MTLIQYNNLTSVFLWQKIHKYIVEQYQKCKSA